MSEPESKVVSQWPQPPSYYKLWAHDSDYDPPGPPPLITGDYTVFGAAYSTNAKETSLKDENVLQLFEEEPQQASDIARHLSVLNRALMWNFVELLDRLIHNPQAHDAKAADIEVIFANIHYLVNSFRPHQAREALLLMMRKQSERRDESISSMKGATQAAMDALVSCRDLLQSKDTAMVSGSPTGLDNSMDVEQVTCPETREPPEKVPAVDTHGSAPRQGPHLNSRLLFDRLSTDAREQSMRAIRQKVASLLGVSLAGDGDVEAVGAADPTDPTSRKRKVAPTSRS